jgi:hypothetical protein
MIQMSLTSRAVALAAAAAIAALVTVAASACGGAARPTGATTPSVATTNGLEKKSAADVLQDAATALNGAKSAHVVLTSPNGDHGAVRIQGGSSTGTLTQAGAHAEITIIGNDNYVKADRAGLKTIGAPPAVQQHDAGRWLKVSAHDVTGFSLASLASQLTSYNGPLEPKVRQATLNGRKVVVVTWRNGGKLYVANTGPAYPLRWDFKGPNPSRANLSEFGAPFHITAPSNPIDLTNAG